MKHERNTIIAKSELIFNRTFFIVVVGMLNIVSDRWKEWFPTFSVMYKSKYNSTGARFPRQLKTVYEFRTFIDRCARRFKTSRNAVAYHFLLKRTRSTRTQQINKFQGQKDEKTNFIYM